MYAKNYFPTRRTMSLVYEHYSQKYFDSVALGKRIVCRTQVDTGFGDDTCPTTGVIAAYNAMTCEKVLNIYQGMAHNCATNYASGVSKQKYSSGEENFKLPYGFSYTFDWEIASVSDSTVLEIAADGHTVNALKKGTATVTFAYSARFDVTVDVETADLDIILSDGSLTAEIAEGMIKSIYTRTGNTAYVASSCGEYDSQIAAGNFNKGISYYVISDFGGDRSYTAGQMYDLFTASGADYLVLIPGKSLSATTAAMYAMQINSKIYPNAYVCDNGSAATEYQTGRNAGNNIVSVIEKNKPILDGNFKVYDANTEKEIESILIVPDGEKCSVVVIPNQPFSIINRIDVSSDGLTMDSDTLIFTGDSDGGKLIIGGKTYTVCASATASGTEDGYSWVLGTDGKLTVFSDGEISDTAYPWAAYADLITEIEVSEGAVRVASGAFANVVNLTKITLTYTLSEIASDAVSGASGYTVYGYENNSASTGFAEAAGVEFVSLGACGSAGGSLIWEYKDGVLYIDGNGTIAESGCQGYGKESTSAWYSYYKNIKKVVIGDSVKTLGAYIFFNMDALTEVELPSGLTTVRAGAFMACDNITSIYTRGNVPVSGTLDMSTVTSFVGGYQFDSGAIKATKLILSDDLTGELGDKFFTRNKYITELTIPAGVTSLAGRSISGNEALRTLTVLGRDTSINSNALVYDSNLSTALTLVKGRIGSPAETFANSKGIEFADITGDKYDGIVLLSGDCGENVYFKVVENETVSGYSLYFYGTGTEIVISSPTPWASYASSITRAVFRGNIESVGSYTLDGLTALNCIELDNCAIDSICANALSGSGISGTFEIPEEITAIDANAFAGLSDLTAVVIQNPETVIDANAFSGTGLATVYGYCKSASETFATENSLTFVNINTYLPVAKGYVYATYNGSPTVNTEWTYDKATKTLSFKSLMDGWNECGNNNYAKDGVGWSIFKNEIEKVIIGDGLGKVSSKAFENHTKLKTVELPSSGLGQIDYRAFYGCTALDTIYIRGSVPIEGVADLHKIGTVSTQLEVFVNCAFDTVIFRTDVTSIEDGTFGGTTIKTVIGNSETTQTLADAVGATEVVKGYATDNTVWTVSGDTLTVYVMGTPAAVTDWSDFSADITKIVFAAESDITALNTGVFDGFANLSEVLFKCDAPDSAASSCFGTNSITVYYAKGITTFTTPSWNGYTCLEEGSTLGILASGICKEGGYTWVIDKDGTLTISGEGNGVLEFTKEPNWNFLTNISWYSYNKDIKKVVIEEETKITRIVSYGLSNMPNCTTIIIPTTLTDFSTYDTFCSLPNLKTIAIQGNEVIEGVIDLRNAVKLNSQLFEASFENTTPTVYLPKSPTDVQIAKWAKASCSEMNFVVYPTSTPATIVRGLIEKQTSASPSTSLPKKINISYYTVEQDSTLVRSGSTDAAYGCMAWSFDDATGTLTFTNNGATGWNEFLYTGNSAPLRNWLAIWKDAVVHIEVVSTFSKLQVNWANSPFSNLVNLETVWFSQASMEWQFSGNNGMFENCYKLTTLGFGSAYTEGVIDLSPIGKYTGTPYGAMFKNCTSVTNVKFRETLPEGENSRTVLSSNMFSGCTSLRSITIPSWITNIAANAFVGCSSISSITLEGTPEIASAESFPDIEGLMIICPNNEIAASINALGYTYTKAIGLLQSAITWNGYSVRIAGYNGLRSMFSFDNTVKTENKGNGYTLVEYGAILASKANIDTYGKELTFSEEKGEYVTPGRVEKRAVYNGDTKVGNTLSTSTDDRIDFAASIVKYDSNFRTDVYIAAYEIWQLPNGSVKIVYTECENEERKYTNIYDIGVEMYKNGIINADNDKESIVWNILSENGAVTLTAGTDYTYTEGQTDLDGNSLEGSFVFRDVPFVSQNVNSTNKTITFTKSGITITLLEDGDSYLAVCRGSGAMPNVNPWGDAGSSQLSSGFCSTYEMTKMPNPKMVAATAQKIKSIVLDYGITTISSGAFASLSGLQKLVYPTSVTTAGGSVFVACSSLTTAYCAEVNDPSFKPVDNIVDFSKLTSVSASYMFTGCKKIEYVHLPANIGTGANGFINQCSQVKAVWCGDVQKQEGTIDFSKTTVKNFGDYSFAYVNSVTTLKLPETVEKFFDTSGTTERHAFATNSASGSACGIRTIVTENEVEYITNYIATYGTTYSLTYTHN